MKRRRKSKGFCFYPKHPGPVYAGVYYTKKCWHCRWFTAAINAINAIKKDELECDLIPMNRKDIVSKE